MRWLVAAVALTWLGCDDTPGKATDKSSLRVPLPDGWKASPVSGGLHVGPGGRVVLQLESTTRPFPPTDAFFSAVEAQGVEMMDKESMETFLGARYSVSLESGGTREAFLGVRQTGPRTIWCSTTASVRGDELEAAMTVCRSLSWEG